jgi:adenylate kinase
MCGILYLIDITPQQIPSGKAIMNINEISIIFVGGIHGVGKTIFSAEASRILKVPCLNASSLITQQRKVPAAINKRVQNVAENQNALIRAIESSHIKKKQFILDGHFCVFDSSDVIRKVPSETFQALAPRAAIVLLDDVENIQVRLQKREKRKYDYALLNQLQKIELEHAESVCNLLKIPLFPAWASEHDKAIQFAAGYLNQRRKRA